MHSGGIRALAVAAARPNFMKVAPLLREMRSRDGWEVVLVHTGQHYDAAMSERFFEDLRIPPPDLNLGVGSGSHAAMTAEVLRRIEPVLEEQRPDVLVVVGDVNSTLAAGLAAAKLGVPVAHVEAGLRSFDRTMPEEVNRLLTDQISSWLFVTEPSGEANLRREGIAPERIHFVGNVMIDSLLEHLERARKLDALEPFGLSPGGYALLTLHRPSNVDDPEQLARLFELLEELHDELPVLFPVHPRTARAVERLRGGRELRLRTTEPLGYLQFLRLLADARIVLTDSGGIQEETTVLGVPCVTLRENTERPVTIEQGTNHLAGTSPDAIRGVVRDVLAAPPRAARVPERWDGGAARRIVDVLEADLGARR